MRLKRTDKTLLAAGLFLTAVFSFCVTSAFAESPASINAQIVIERIKENDNAQKLVFSVSVKNKGQQPIKIPTGFKPVANYTLGGFNFQKETDGYIAAKEYVISPGQETFIFQFDHDLIQHPSPDPNKAVVELAVKNVGSVTHTFMLQEKPSLIDRLMGKTPELTPDEITTFDIAETPLNTVKSPALEGLEDEGGIRISQTQSIPESSLNTEENKADAEPAFVNTEPEAPSEIPSEPNEPEKDNPVVPAMSPGNNLNPAPVIHSITDTNGNRIGGSLEIYEDEYLTWKLAVDDPNQSAFPFVQAFLNQNNIQTQIPDCAGSSGNLCLQRELSDQTFTFYMKVKAEHLIGNVALSFIPTEAQNQNPGQTVTVKLTHNWCQMLPPAINTNNPAMQKEYSKLLELVNEADATKKIMPARCFDQLQNEGRLTGNEVRAPLNGMLSWSGLNIAPDDRIVIQEGAGVLMDQNNETTLDWIRVDGNFTFDTNQNSALKVKTLVVTPPGQLVIGDAETPVRSDVIARLILADRGVRDEAMRQKDPLDFSGGLISLGSIKMYGALQKNYAFLNRVDEQDAVLSKNASELMFAEPVLNWQIGDRLILSGMNPDGGKPESINGIAQVDSNGKLLFTEREDEELEITGISADRKKVQFVRIVHDANHNESRADSTLHFDHDKRIPAGNLTRNIMIESENKDDLERRGHVMFMQSTAVEIDGAGFYHLGRTDTKYPQTVPTLDASDRLNPGTDQNTKGRYPVYFYGENTPAKNDIPAFIRNSAIYGSPKHGIANRGSYVFIERNVIYNAGGAHVFLENGSEIGKVSNNLMIRSQGNSYAAVNPGNPSQYLYKADDYETRSNAGDFGHAGHGIWAQGGGVDIADNYAAGHASAAYAFYPRMLKENGNWIYFKVQNLETAHAAQLDEAVLSSFYGAEEWERFKNEIEARDLQTAVYQTELLKLGDTVPVTDIPFYFVRNYGTASKAAFRIIWHSIPSNLVSFHPNSLMRDSVFWNNSFGAESSYSSNIHFKNVNIIGSLRLDGVYGFIGGADAARQIYENLRIENYGAGLVLPTQTGESKVIGGYFKNKTCNIQIYNPQVPARQLTLDLRNAMLGKTAGTNDPNFFDICLQNNFVGTRGFTFNESFKRKNQIFILHNGIAGGQMQQLFSPEQLSGFIPFRQETNGSGTVTLDTLTKTELDGKTNDWIWQNYRIAVNGALAPSNAIDCRASQAISINGFAGNMLSDAVYMPALSRLSAGATSNLAYTMKVRVDSTGEIIQQDVTLTPNGQQALKVTRSDGTLLGSVFVTHQ